MLKLATTPEMSASLDKARKLGCAGLRMALFAMLKESIDCLQKPKHPNERAVFDRAHLQFQNRESEHWILVKIFVAFQKQSDTSGDSTSTMH